MTWARIRGTVGPRPQYRALQTGYPFTGYNYADPSAIPPPGAPHVERAGMIVNEHTLLQVDTVYFALRIISNNIISMGNLRSYTWGLSDDNIPYRQFQANQPPILTNTFGGGGLGGQGGTVMQCTGMDRTIWSMALFGEAFWYILREQDFLEPQAVDVLHPAFMEVKRHKGDVQPTYIYGSGQNKQELDPDNVIHIPHKSLPTANRALDPISYAGIVGGLALAAYEFGSSWFSQGQSPDFILSTDQKLGQAEVDRIADKFMIRHAGPMNAHRPVVLDSGLAAEKIMASPDEAQYLNTLEYSRQCVGAWFGIPPSKMPNAMQRQPSAPPHVRQEEQEGFIADTLTGYTEPMEEAHSALLEAADEFAGFDEARLTRADAQFLAQKIQALRLTQAYSINDVRTRELGVPPVNDPRADDPLAPLASNTAPSQTGNQGMFPDAGPSNNPGASDERTALLYIANRLRQLDGHADHLMVT